MALMRSRSFTTVEGVPELAMRTIEMSLSSGRGSAAFAPVAPTIIARTTTLGTGNTPSRGDVRHGNDHRQDQFRKQVAKPQSGGLGQADLAHRHEPADCR